MVKTNLTYTVISAVLLLAFSIATAGVIFELGKYTPFVLLMIASAVCMLVCWGLFCRRQKKYLDRLSRLATEVSSITNNLGAGLQLEQSEKSEELFPLIKAINRMFDSIGSYQSALNESESRYRAIFERAPDSILILAADGDDAGKVVSANSAAAEMRRCSREELIGIFFSEMCAPESIGVSEELLRRTVAGENTTGELWHLRRDGTRFRLELHAGLLQIGTRKLILAFDRDITVRASSEEQFRRLNAELSRKANDMAALNRELEAFNYSVSHDIRGPLTRISGYCQLMLENAERLGPDFREYVSRIYESSCWLDEMVDAMLDLSHLSRAEFITRRVDLSAMVNDLLEELMVAEPGRAVEAQVQVGVEVEGDLNLLRIMMSNLIGNAWKYTAGREKTNIEFGVDHTGDAPFFFVRDNGIGFDKKHAEKLFRVFTRLPASSQFAGSGIGLATVQRIVTRHGGKVWAEAEVGQGATFCFTLGNAEPSISAAMA